MAKKKKYKKIQNPYILKEQVFFICMTSISCVNSIKTIQVLVSDDNTISFTCFTW